VLWLEQLGDRAQTKMGQQVTRGMLCSCNDSGSVSPTRRRRDSNGSASGRCPISRSPTRTRGTASFHAVRTSSDVSQDLLSISGGRSRQSLAIGEVPQEVYGVVARGRKGKEQLTAWSNIGMTAM